MKIKGSETKRVMEFQVTQVQLLLCQGMPVPAVSQFQTRCTNISSTLSDDEPALLIIRTLVDAFRY